MHNVAFKNKIFTLYLGMSSDESSIAVAWAEIYNFCGNGTHQKFDYLMIVYNERKFLFSVNLSKSLVSTKFEIIANK